MKKYILPLMAVAAMAVSCSSGKTDKDAAEAPAAETAVIEETMEITTVNDPQAVVQTKWRLADYGNGSEVVTVAPEENYELTFGPDSNFSLTTDCNAINGKYTISADSLQFSDTFSTKMACPNSAVEDAMSQQLPVVDGYRMPTPGVLLLTSDARTVATFTAVE